MSDRTSSENPCQHTDLPLSATSISSSFSTFGFSRRQLHLKTCSCWLSDLLSSLPWWFLRSRSPNGLNVCRRTYMSPLDTNWMYDKPWVLHYAWSFLQLSAQRIPIGYTPYYLAKLDSMTCLGIDNTDCTGFVWPAHRIASRAVGTACLRLALSCSCAI